ncbi:AbrB/MazE/SpoVT family DNA-binding domain-containing protein [Alicyclobacillus macrosporangiidus]|uniref:Transcriptional pleiotropic regulator of transition state genes n=1 Tax=Alicyclobacillus macrosporangiidus TaxID=392015 RepID=A0A1I7L9H9_9BACL|nr:AbrB/MazE/SpoVT family DNA-binding domain-containing protein [Alicyclobacillus macrosporangiidus]SFV06186.1 transcriptional pleiotropic regulator of transition state genes [Alicyclobacillus macrosporangiidus]
MKSTGVVRRVDELGRVVLPIELRRTMNIHEKDIFTKGDRIILRKYEPGCIFCNEVEDVKEFRGKMVCEKCREEIAANVHVQVW